MGGKEIRVKKCRRSTIDLLLPSLFSVKGPGKIRPPGGERPVALIGLRPG